MPSTKDPVAVVQPGPGRLPDGTVTATSLDFSPSAGTNAALQAHITDPIGAHQDSAIATGAFGGSEPWSVSAGSVETAIAEVFNGLNSRAALVLDANPASTTADFAGANALINAYSATPANNKTVFYLRPGVYSWNDANQLQGVTIIGGGSPSNNSATSQVEIENLAGNIRFANGCTVRNVLLRASGDISVLGDGSSNGYNVFENVTLDATGGGFLVSCSHNSFKQTGTSFATTTPVHLASGGNSNSYENIVFGQILNTGNNNTFSSVTVGVLAAPIPASSIVDILGSDNVVTGLLVTSTTLSALSIVSVAGNRNTLRDVRLTGTKSTGPLVSIAGTGNDLVDLTVASTTSYAAPVVRFLSADNSSISNVRITGMGATAGAGFQLVAMVTSFNCAVRRLVANTSSSMGTTSTLIQVNGCTRCQFEDIDINGLGAAVAIGAPLFGGVTAASRDLSVRNVRITGSFFASGGGNVFDVASNLFTGKCTFERLHSDSTVSISGGTTLNVLRVSGTPASAADTLLFDKCTFIGVSTGQNTVSAALGGNMAFKDCYFEATAATTAGVASLNGTTLSMTDCTFVATSGNGVTASGGVFTRCKFMGGPTGSAKTLFLGTNSSIANPLKLIGCSMVLGANNIVGGSATTIPPINFGGSGAGSTADHGAITVDGLLISADAAVTVWHSGPTLRIDAASEAREAKSSYKDITIDLNEIVWTQGGTGCSGISDIDNLGAVVEVQGASDSIVASCKSVSIKNLAVLRPSYNGAGNRHIVKAVGCEFDGLTIGASAGVGGSGYASTVALLRCNLNNLSLFPNNTLMKVGSNSYVEAKDSIITGTRIVGWLASTPAPFVSVLSLDHCVLSGSQISFGGTAFAGAVIDLPTALWGASSTGRSIITSNNIELNHNASSTSDQLGTMVVNAASDYNCITSNVFTNLAVPTGSGASQSGGGIHVVLSGDNNRFSENTVGFTWLNHTATPPVVLGSGNNLAFDSNIFRNDAIPAFGQQGGSLTLFVTQATGTIIGNSLVGNNTATNISLQATGGSNRIVAHNCVENQNAGAVGTMNSAGSDKPTPLATYNILI